MIAVANDAIDLPTVVHCFRVRSETGEEIPLSADLAFLEAFAAVHGQHDDASSSTPGMIFVSNSLPWLAAVGELPAGFVAGKAASTAELCFRCREYWKRSAATAATNGAEGGGSSVEAEGGEGAGDGAAGERDDGNGEPAVSRDGNLATMTSRIQEVMDQSLKYGLWVHEPCYSQHTRPAVLRGTRAAGAIPLAMMHCWRHRLRLQFELMSVSQTQILAMLAALLTALRSALAKGPFLDGATSPQVADVILCSYIRVLLAVPDPLAPWAELLASPVQQQQQQSWRKFLEDYLKIVYDVLNIEISLMRQLGATGHSVQRHSNGLRLGSPCIAEEWDRAMSQEQNRLANGGYLGDENGHHGAHPLQRRHWLGTLRFWLLGGPDAWTGPQRQNNDNDADGRATNVDDAEEASSSPGKQRGKGRRSTAASPADEVARPADEAKQRRRDVWFVVWVSGSFLAYFAWRRRLDKAS